MSGSHLRRQQFTVIELLVVATIISVLASLLLPALTEAKFAARVTACQGNLQQTSRAIIMFANDRERRYLPSGHWGESVLGIAPPSGYQSDEWGARPADVAEYGMTAEVAQCPGVSGEYHRQRRVYWYYNWPVKKGFDYLYRGGYGNHPSAANGYYWQYRGYFLRSGMTVNSANDPLSPASVIFLSDISYNTTSSYPGWYYRNTVNANFVQQPPIDPSNHPGPDGVWQARVSNRVYADGHIIAYRDFRRPNVTAASGYWCKDYYTYYY